MHLITNDNGCDVIKLNYASIRTLVVVRKLTKWVCDVDVVLWSVSLPMGSGSSLGNVCCRCAASSSVVRVSVQKVSAALRIPPILWPPMRTAQWRSAWTQWWDAAIATPAAISIPLCTSKPISRPHSLGLARYAKLTLSLSRKSSSFICNTCCAWAHCAQHS